MPLFRSSGARRSGAIPWTLDEGRCGLLVDVRDPGAIAEGILRLFADPGLAAELGQAARSRAVTTFSADAVVRGYLDAYATAIQEQAPAKIPRSSGQRRTGVARGRSRHEASQACARLFNPLRSPSGR